MAAAVGAGMFQFLIGKVPRKTDGIAHSEENLFQFLIGKVPHGNGKGDDLYGHGMRCFNSS